MKLTEAQRAILRAMARMEHKGWPPQTGPEISDYLDHAPRWAADKIASLEKRWLVERLGQSATGGNCYHITDTGRAALEASNA